jgi:EAL domain-containing protein (putative c-di-GMP-specific phosphodiesterase class I)
VANSEFASRDLLGQIERLGAKYETGWQWLRLDIKEEAVVADARHSIRKLSELREALQHERVDFLQGYAIARPAYAIEAAAWLRGTESMSGEEGEVLVRSNV